MKLKKFACLSLITLAAVFCSVSYAQTFSVVHTFTGVPDGKQPLAGVTIRGGSLFGPSLGGGDRLHPVYGTVYQAYRSGSQWTTTPLVHFTDPNGGPWSPEARVMFGPDGHLYGTTRAGGINNGGTVFQLTPPLSLCKTAKCSGGSWTQKVLHKFGDAFDGNNPGSAEITFDPQGNLYGTTLYGGASGNQNGSVYELLHSGNTWTENILYTFQGQPDGQIPAGGVIRDNNGNLFGTTVLGGQNNFGSVFKVTNVPGVGWVETILYSFQNAGDGENPSAGLAMDQAGNLYGATASGGSGDGGGVVFELSPSGNTWNFHVLHTFPSFSCGPQTSLSIDTAGNLYGATFCDGAQGDGNVFKLSKTGNDWTYTSLHDFTGGADGWRPVGVAIDMDGTLYGVTEWGGDMNCFPGQGCGVVWMIKQ